MITSCHRGADIIESLRHKQIAHRHDHEKQVLHKIKRKMERIRATQQKMLRPLDKQTHFDGKLLWDNIQGPFFAPFFAIFFWCSYFLSRFLQFPLFVF